MNQEKWSKFGARPFFGLVPMAAGYDNQKTSLSDVSVFPSAPLESFLVHRLKSKPLPLVGKTLPTLSLSLSLYLSNYVLTATYECGAPNMRTPFGFLSSTRKKEDMPVRDVQTGHGLCVASAVQNMSQNHEKMAPVTEDSVPTLRKWHLFPHPNKDTGF